MNKKLTIFFIIPIILISGCSGIAPASPTVAPVPTSTATLQPTSTATATVVPTQTSLLTDTPDVIGGLIPQGQPVSEWNGIPIMPDAIAGDGDVGGYRFTTQSTQAMIQAFYERELTKQGWQLLGAGNGDTGAVILIFSSGDGTLSVSIIPNGDTSIVLIVK